MCYLWFFGKSSISSTEWHLEVVFVCFDLCLSLRFSAHMAWDKLIIVFQQCGFRTETFSFCVWLELLTYTMCVPWSHEATILGQEYTEVEEVHVEGEKNEAENRQKPKCDLESSVENLPPGFLISCHFWFTLAFQLHEPFSIYIIILCFYLRYLVAPETSGS